MANTERPVDNRTDDAVKHPKWDRKQGTPKDENSARKVERASGRYSASEQSEEKMKDRDPE